MKTFFRILSATILSLTIASAANAQNKISCEQYIATYAPLAMQQQKLYGIPASIKMAQGILESANGNSSLSQRSNNHFGIKCKSNWVGDTVLYDDDARGECFRRYNSIEESYTDHSLFLKGSARYASLFELDPTDYKGWAHGLKKAGYATAPHYAPALIDLIEKYELYMLDDGEFPTYLAGIEPVVQPVSLTGYYPESQIDIDDFVVSVHTVGDHGIFLEGGNRYIVAREGETFADIAQEIGIPEKRLRRFNKGARENISAGQIVYIEKPRRRG